MKGGQPMTKTITKVADSDFMSPEFLANPYPYYQCLRETEPVRFVKPLGAYFLTRAADIRLAFGDPRFIQGYEAVQRNRFGDKVAEQDLFQFGREFLPVLDPPAHGRLRRIFRVPFTPKRVAALAEETVRITDRCIDDFIADGSTELIATYAARVPNLIIGELLGIPEEMHHEVHGWVHVFLEALFATPMTDEYLGEINGMTREAKHYFLGLVKERRANPGDDFISAVITANETDEDPLTDHQLASNIFLMYFAGFDTQRETFSLMVAALGEHPDAMAYLAEDPSRIRECMHEIWRWDPVSHVLGRIATEDVELSGVTIPAGSPVLVSAAAGCRDPEVYPNPETFDLHRPPTVDPTRFLVFGNGPHMCLGKQLAMSNMETMLTRLITRLPNLTVDWDKAVLMQTFGARGYDELFVNWDPPRT